MQHTPLSYDYVLVAKTIENQEREAFRKQNEYIEELKKKNIKVTVSVNLKKSCNLFSLIVPFKRVHDSFFHLIHIHFC